MTRRKKTVLIILAVVILVPALALVVLLSRLGTIIKIGFEKAGPRVLHVETGLRDATVYPLKGEVTLEGLSIGNPSGYKEPTLFQAELIHVNVRPLALLSKEIHVEEIRVDGPRFTVEFKDGKSNISALLEGLEQGAEEEPAPEEPETPAKDSGTRLKVDRVQISNAQVNVAVMGSSVKLTLPTLELPPIADKDGNGVPPNMIAREILLGVTGPIEDALKVSEAAQAIEASLKQVRGNAKALEEEARQASGQIGDEAENAGDELKKTGDEFKKVGDGLVRDAKDIFKK